LLEGLSAHADQHELIAWLSAMGTKPSKIFVVHGEVPAAGALKSKLEMLGYTCEIPSLYGEYDC
jgi:metallo-beta-lactamase family protein